MFFAPGCPPIVPDFPNPSTPKNDLVILSLSKDLLKQFPALPDSSDLSAILSTVALAKVEALWRRRMFFVLFRGTKKSPLLKSLAKKHSTYKMLVVLLTNQKDYVITSLLHFSVSSVSSVANFFIFLYLRILRALCG
jgi:hypothetical protein